jgi:hypothetical protein
MLWPLLYRFKREEIKIHAWEDHQKAKIEAEMRKIEVSNFLPSNIAILPLDFHVVHIPPPFHNSCHACSSNLN